MPTKGRPTKSQPVEVEKVFARQLREVRTAKGWSQKQLADRIGEMGAPMHQTAIAKIENEDRSVSLEDALRIAAALGVQLQALLLERDDKPVAIAPNFVESSDILRLWLTGETGQLVADATVDPVSTRWFGREVGTREAEAERRFFDDQRSDAELRAFRHPGVQWLLAAANAYVRSAGTDDRKQMRVQLDQLRREVERQYEQLDAEGAPK